MSNSKKANVATKRVPVRSVNVLTGAQFLGTIAAAAFVSASAEQQITSLRNERKRAALASPVQVASERITGDLPEGEAMVEVRLSSGDVEVASLTAIAKGLGRYFPSVAVANREYYSTSEKINKNSVRLNITRQFMTAPYEVSTRHGVTLSMWQSEGICPLRGYLAERLPHPVRLAGHLTVECPQLEPALAS